MKSLEVDRIHVLEDLLDMYHFKDEEVLVCEAFANAQDVFLEDEIKNPTIEITLEKTSSGGFINFHNNGTPMTTKQFDKYHVIASSVILAVTTALSASLVASTASAASLAVVTDPSDSAPVT